MRNVRSCMLVALVAVGTLGALAGPAWAHRLKVFARVEGGVVRGEGYMPGGGVPQGVVVLVLNSAGGEIGRTRTDDKGVFAYTPTSRQDLTFVIDSGDGHRAEFSLAADELPASLPAAVGGGAPASQPGTATPAPSTPIGTGETQAKIAMPRPAGPAGMDAGQVRRIVAQELARQLDRYEEKVRLRDILGGIGYILGVMGVVMMLKRRRGTSPG